MKYLTRFSVEFQFHRC